jgi:hypothetical protein
MQHNKEKQFWHFCFLFVVIAYLPVVTFQYAVKNDFFTAYFPLKKFLTTSLDAGSFPVWNPFLNYGFPIYGDMSEAWWNPVTWFIAAVPGYSVWTFTLELVAYLFVAFLGMYTLTGRWIRQIEWRIMAAASYSASGFMVGHLQHFNWISAAALLPFCLHYLLSYATEGRKKSFFLAAFFLAFFATAAHPGLIIGTMVYGLLWLLQSTTKTQILPKRISVLALVILATCAGMIYAYSEVLPYTNRDASLQVGSSSEGSTTIASWISFILPLSVTRGDFFTNDIALRNCYFGLLGLALCCSFFFAPAGKRVVRFHLVLGTAFLILSSDFFLPAFQQLPLFKYIRLNGELRIFALLSFILAATIQLQEIWVTGKDKRLLQILWTLEALLMVSCIAAGVYALPGWPEKWRTLTDLKLFLTNLTFSDTVFIQSALLLLLNLLMIQSIKRRNKQVLLFVFLADMALACLLQLPFTGVGQRSVSEVGQIFAMAPSAQKKPSTAAEESVVKRYPDVKAVAGNWALVSQEIAQDGLIPYPLILRNASMYMESKARDSLYSKPPFLLVSGSDVKPIEPSIYTYNKLHFQTNTTADAAIMIKQNSYPYWRAFLNGKQVAIEDTAYTFMKIPLTAGKNELEFQFSHPLIKVLLVFQFLMMTLLVIMAYRYRNEVIA